jgi:hypothetical protein
LLGLNTIEKELGKMESNERGENGAARNCWVSTIGRENKKQNKGERRDR